jgi:hypothetical protein
MAHQISTSIQINASAEDVWSVFKDFEKYPKWNPLIRSITGELKIGARLVAVLDNMTFKPVIKVLKPNAELTWLGHLLMPGIFDGRHSYILEENQDGTTRFIHRERFTGLLIPLMRKKLDTEVKSKFEAMNIALKERVEAQISNL